MNKETSPKTSRNKFARNLPDDFVHPKDAVGKKLLREYGAMFVAQNVKLPKTIVFENETEVFLFQESLVSAEKNINGFQIKLQRSAMEKLQDAIDEAEKNNLSISPRGADAAKRIYSDTVSLWASRVNPALEHWVKEGKINKKKAEKIRSLSPFAQVAEIFKLEKKGIFFSKDLSKTIIYSVAPPGASQHLALLAIDVNEHANLAVREILARNYWFQTVISDLPHFTFLGASREELSDFGLKRVVQGEREFWIPKI